MSDRAVVDMPVGEEPPAADAPAITRGEILAVRAAAAAAAGGVLWAAFPSLGWWPLAPVAVGAFAVSLRGAGARSGALTGFAFGLGFFLPHLHWSGVYVGTLPWVALATLEAAFLAVLGTALTWAWRIRGGVVALVPAVSGLWVLQEAARSRVPFGGFPWGRLAFSQAESPFAGLAALGGVPLVSAAVAAAGALLAWVAVAAVGRSRAIGVGAAILSAVALALAGTLVPRPATGERSVRVAAVQGNVPRAGLDFNAERRAVLDNHAAATLDVARGTAGSDRPELVIWPENASDIDPLRNPDAAAVIDRAARAVGVPVLVGAVLHEPRDALSNATIVWDPVTGPGERYVKQHPAPFGEYIPARRFFRRFSDKVDLVPRDFAAGRRIGLLRAGPVLASDVICFEVAYDDLVRQPVRRGADVVVVQTNNATFGRTDESVQQLAMSQLRAVELGRSVVHISTVGISALITPDGRVVDRSGHFEQEVLTATLPLRTDLTLAARVGAVPEWVLAAIGALLAVAGAAGRAGGGRRPAGPGGRAGEG